MRSTRRSAAALTLVTVALAGCAGEEETHVRTAAVGGPATATATSTDWATWRSSGVRPVSPVVAAAGRFLTYGVRAGRYELVALDPADGHVVWRRPSSAGRGTVTPWPLVQGRTVLHLQPGTGSGSTVTVLDAATGAPRATGSALQAVEPLQPCRDDTALTCVVTTGGRALRVDPRTGRATPLPPETATRPDEHGLVRGPYTVTRRVGTKAVWDVDGGAVRLPSGRPLAVRVAGSTAAVTFVPSAAQVDRYARRRTVGLDLATGTVRWRRSGITLCGRRPGELIGCAITGDGRGGTCTRVRVTLVGLDPLTGRTRWRVPLGAQPDGAPRDLRPCTPRLEQTTTGATLVTFADRAWELGPGGKARPLAADTALWDPAPDQVLVEGRPVEPDGLVRTLTPAGARRGARPAQQPVDVGATAGGIRAVATPDAVIGLRER